MVNVDVIVDLKKGENRILVESEDKSVEVHVSGHYMPQDGEWASDLSEEEEKSENKGDKKVFIAFMRHGERGDKVYEEGLAIE